MDKKNLHEGHRERLKKRFLDEGLDSFQDHNILELLLFYSIPRRDTNELAHALLNRFNSLSGVFDAPFEELCRLDGIGENTATLIKLIPLLSSRYRTDKFNEEGAFDSIDDIGKFLVEHYAHHTVECVILLCFDNADHLISIDELFEGSVTNVEISVRRIVEIAITKQASSIVLAHNHPRGRLIPSDDDRAVTMTLIKALSPIGLNFKEHLLIAGKRYLAINRWMFENFATYRPAYMIEPASPPKKAPRKTKKTEKT